MFIFFEKKVRYNSDFYCYDNFVNNVNIFRKIIVIKTLQIKKKSMKHLKYTRFYIPDIK